MKTPFFSIPRHLALHTLATLCISLGGAYPLLLAMDIAASPALCAACCACAALCLMALDCLPRLRGLAYPLLLCAMIAVLLPYRDQTQAVTAALALFANGQPLALAAYAQPVCMLVSLAMTGVAAPLARSEHAFFPVALLTIGELLVISFLGANVSAFSLLPLVLALLLLGRAPGTSLLRVLPAAAVVLAGALLLMPFSGQTVPEFSRIADNVRRMIDDYFFFTEPRTPFSFAATGYQPYGAERMGGPAQPTDDPVMQVAAEDRTLLRATIKNEYTGLAWADTTSGRRYLLMSPRFASLRRDLFDQARPGRELLDALPQSRQITVLMQQDAASTLFLTQRFKSPRGDGVVSYYSPSSEVFATRSLAAGDSYTFFGRPLTAASQGIRETVLSAYDPADPNYASVRSLYLQLPSAVEDRVYQLASQLTAQESNDFDRAAALCAYLQSSFPYTLQQNTPPLTQDFVSWFLFEEQKGYCTSFASALCVMARAVGLPSRYIEGYAAQPDSDGVARVTQQNGHAWTEIYFPGFGWLTFDPTPGMGRAPDTSGNSGGENPPESNIPQDSSADQTPTPSPAPTPSPTPSPVPTPTPSPTPEHNDPSVTPTPPVTPEPTPQATPTPTQPPAPPDDPDQPDDPDDPDKAPWLLFLLLIASIALVVLRFILTAPARVAARYRNPGDSLLIWYRATQEALLCLGIAPEPGEAPATFLLRAQETLGGKINLLVLGKALCVARYSPHRLKSAQAQKGAKAYAAVWALLTPAQKLHLYARRFIRGTKLE